MRRAVAQRLARADGAAAAGEELRSNPGRGRRDGASANPWLLHVARARDRHQSAPEHPQIAAAPGLRAARATGGGSKRAGAWTWPVNAARRGRADANHDWGDRWYRAGRRCVERTSSDVLSRLWVRGVQGRSAPIIPAGRLALVSRPSM